MKHLPFKFIVLLLLVLIGCGGKDKPKPNDPPPVAKYDNKTGVGHYALESPAFPAQASKDVLKDASQLRVSVIYNTFAEKGKTSGSGVYTSDPRTIMIQHHLINEVCYKNQQCGSYELLAGLKPGEFEKKLRNKDKAFLAKFDAYINEAAAILNPLYARPGMTCYINPLLESQLPTDLGAWVTERVRPKFPTCKMVWNGNGTVPNTVKEVHGSSTPVSAPCIVNLDGQDIDFVKRPTQYTAVKPIHESKLPDFIKRYAHCDAIFLWTAEDNCRTKSWKDPRQRTACPNQLVLDEVAKFILGNYPDSGK